MAGGLAIRMLRNLVLPARLTSIFLVFAALVAPAGGQSGALPHIQKFPRYPASQARPSAFANFNLAYYGGPVMSNAQVVVVFWSSNVAASEQTNVGPFFAAVTNSSWMDILSEYYTLGRTSVSDGLVGSEQIIGRGSYVNSYTITPKLCGSGVSCSLTDVDIQTELVAQLTAGNLPQPQFDAAGNANTLYMTFFPPGVSISSGGFNSCQAGGFCAYHGTANYNSKPLIYGVAPDFTTGGCTSGCGTNVNNVNNLDAVCSHELAESVTDADVGSAATFDRPLAWYDINNGEIGDICNGQDTTTTVNGTAYSVQALWSNLQGLCTGGESPVLQLPSTTSLSSPAVQAKFRQRIAFTASVMSGVSAVTTGTVTFYDGAKSLGQPMPLDAQGQASFTTNQLTIGHHPITANYSGSATFMPSPSNIVDQYRSPKPH